MKTKKWRIILCIFSWLLCALSACIGMSMLTKTEHDFSIRFLYTISFFGAPVFIFLAIIILIKQKTESKTSRRIIKWKMIVSVLIILFITLAETLGTKLITASDLDPYMKFLSKLPFKLNYMFDLIIIIILFAEV